MVVKKNTYIFLYNKCSFTIHRLVLVVYYYVDIRLIEFELLDNSSILDFFEAFVTPNLLGKVAFETNRYCQQFDNVTPGSR